MSGLGSSFDALKQAYGPPVHERLESDLHAHSCDFADGRATLTATFLLGRVSHLGVYFEQRPAAAVSSLLEEYSGMSGWQRVPNTDPRFAQHFSAFNPEGERNQLHLASGGVALVQHRVPFGELVLWIEEHAYPELLREYRRRRRS